MCREKLAGLSWRKTILLAAILLTGWILAYSGSTKLVMSWKNPKYSGPHLRRILVIGMSENPTVRADFEDALSTKITRDGLEAVPGNAILLRPDSPSVNLDLKAGALGYVQKSCMKRHLVPAIQAALAGQPYISLFDSNPPSTHAE
jgi:hypothetical protein